MGNYVCCRVQPREKEIPEPIILDNVTAQEKSEPKQEKKAIAIYSLQAKEPAILNFAKGDTIVIEDDSDPDWYLGRHSWTQERGFAPKNYLVIDDNAGREEWFFECVNREDAERLLLLPENKAGTFMIRNSSSAGVYALSVKYIAPESESEMVKHYKIRRLDSGGFYVSPTKTFPTLQQLVSFYAVEAYGLCCRLEKACPKTRPAIPGPSNVFRDEYEISYDSLKFIRSLGRGDFGEVSYGLWNDTFEVAIKRLLSNSVQPSDFLREISVMKAIRHPKIVRLYAVCTEREPFCIVMEYMPKGNLQHFLKSPEGCGLKLPTLVNISAQVADGMKYLEERNLIHRDLAARNILVGQDNVVKLADFGLARILDEAVYVTRNGKVPIKWTAPEAYSGKFTIKSDVWSYGVVLYEIFTHGGPPYSGMRNQVVVDKVKQGYRMPKPFDPECSDAVYDMILLCWKTNPEDRPTFEFLYHYFMDFNVSSEGSYDDSNVIS